MVDSIGIYFLYAEDFTAADRLEVFDRLLGLEGYEPAEDVADTQDWWERTVDALVDGSYGSITVWVDLDPDADGIPGVPKIELSIDQMYFDSAHYSDEELDRHIADTVDLVKSVYECSRAVDQQPLYVIGGDASQSEWLYSGRQSLQTTADGVRAREVEDVYWVQILPPEVIATIDQDRRTVTSAPAHTVEELEDGSVLLLTAENPLEYEDRYAKIKERFGLEDSR